MLVTSTGDSDGREVANAGFKEGAVCSLQSCFLCCRKVKGIISCFMLPSLNQARSLSAQTVISLALPSIDVTVLHFCRHQFKSFHFCFCFYIYCDDPQSKLPHQFMSPPPLPPLLPLPQEDWHLSCV